MVGDGGDSVAALGVKMVTGDAVGGGGDSGDSHSATVGRARVGGALLAGGTLAGGTVGGILAGTARGSATHDAGGTYAFPDGVGGGPHPGICGTAFVAAG